MGILAMVYIFYIYDENKSFLLVPIFFSIWKPNQTVCNENPHATEGIRDGHFGPNYT